VEDLTKQELLELLNAYDDYIQDTNDGDRYRGGDFYPVCISEFYQNDLEFWKESRHGEDTER
jgi:hypothetical protein